MDTKKITKKILMITDTYPEDGQQKNKWEQIGILVEKNGKQSIKFTGLLGLFFHDSWATVKDFDDKYSNPEFGQEATPFTKSAGDFSKEATSAINHDAIPF